MSSGLNRASRAPPVAFHIVYRAPDGTLTDAEVDAAHANVVKDVGERFGATSVEALRRSAKAGALARRRNMPGATPKWRLSAFPKANSAA